MRTKLHTLKGFHKGSVHATISRQSLLTCSLLDQRAPFLTDLDLRQETHAYLAGACRELGVPSLIVGGVEDHEHISCYMSRTISMADLVAEIKRESSKWIKTKDDRLNDFCWQRGYGIFSLSPSHEVPT